MGLDLILTDANEADAAAVAIEYIPAVTRGLRGWWSPASSAAESTRNFFLGGASAAVSGTVTYSAGYATFVNGAGNIQTDISETNNMTLMVAARSFSSFVDLANSPVLMGNVKSTGGVGLILRKDPGGAAAPRAQAGLYAFFDNAGTPQSQLATLNVADATAWDIYSGVVENAVGVKLTSYKSGLTNSRTTALSRALNTVDKIQIGNTTLGWGGSADIPVGVIHDVALTDSERQDQFQSIVSFLSALRNITI